MHHQITCTATSFCFAVCVVCTLTSARVPQSQPNAEAMDVVQAWVDSHIETTAYEIAWEHGAVRADPVGRLPEAAAGGQATEVTVYRYRCRWPDVLYTEEELISRESAEGSIDFRSARDYSLRAEAGRRQIQMFVTPEGDMIQRSPGVEQFDVQAEGVSLKQLLGGYVMNIPMLLAHSIHDSGLEAFQIQASPSGEIRVQRNGGTFVYVLAPVAPGGKMVMSRIEQVNEAGVVVLAYDFREFRHVEKYALPVAHLRALSMGSERKVTMDGDRPVRVEYSGALKEMSVDRLVSFAAYDTLPDSAFIPDLDGFTTFDESSGRLMDSDGNVVGQTTARRKISRPRQWSTLIGAGGVAFIVFAIGAWWIRRRGA